MEFKQKDNEPGVIRNNWMYDKASGAFAWYLNKKFDVNVSGEGVPGEGPALILFNHNEIDDLGLEGIGLKHFGRRGNYGMRNTLWFQHVLKKACGGVPLARPVDYGIVDGMDEDLRAAVIVEMNKVNRPAMKYIRQLLKDYGEVFVLHPEGTRGRSTDIGAVDTCLVEYVGKLNKKVDGGIPLVYGGIHYGTEGKRPEVTIKFRKGDWNVGDLEGTIQQELSDLSGYNVS